jgi:hypothetical protein
MMRKIFLIAFAFLLVSCAGVHADLSAPFEYKDLLALDPPDANPEGDVIAVYARGGLDWMQLRIDFLDLDPTAPAPADVTIALYSSASSNSPDALIQIPAIDPPRVIDLLGRPIAPTPRVIRDTTLDAILIEIPHIKSIRQIQIFTRLNNESADRTDRIDLAASPPKPAQLQLAFDRVFEAFTPAQALRAWDGAHSGPQGVRHGLKHLLDASEKYQVPVTLLDLKMAFWNFIVDSNDTGWWSALDYINQTEKVNSLEAKGLVKVYGRSYPRPDDLLILEPTTSGLSHDLKSLLIYQAMNDPATPVKVGNDLPDSAWGNFTNVQAAFADIRNHPWILSSAYTERPFDEDKSVPVHYMSLKDSKVYWLYEGTARDGKSFIFQSSSNLCTDGYCVIVQGHFKVSIDLRGGYMMYLYKDYDELIGPRAQLQIVVSDLSEWDFSRGLGADPGQVMGAFIDADNSYELYSYVWDGDALILTSADGTKIKTYRLIENGLEFTYQGPGGATHIPLIVDPSSRFSPGWADHYHLERSGDAIRWGLDNGPMVRIQAQGASISADTFLDSRDLMALPEDPNAEFPPGHYLPFPMAMLTLTSNGGYFVSISVEK